MIRKVADRLYRGPRVQPEEYRQLKALGIDIMLCLENDPKIKAWVDALCRANGITPIFRPMSEIWPTSVKELNEIADEIEKQRRRNLDVYLCCRRGIDRTGQVAGDWQIRYGGLTFEEAYAEQISFGHPELYGLLGWKWILSKVRRSS